LQLIAGDVLRSLRSHSLDNDLDSCLPRPSCRLTSLAGLEKTDISEGVGACVRVYSGICRVNAGGSVVGMGAAKAVGRSIC
jgi:hypothetical protein